MRQLLLATICATLTAAPLRAATQDAAQAMQTNVQALLPGAVTMAPIPDQVAGDDIGDTVAAAGNEKECLTTAVYFEARGESTKGQKAVAEVILTRTRVAGRPRTICGVVYEGSQRRTGCQFSFACDGIADVVRDWPAWRKAERVADWVLRMRGKVKPVARGATYYHADSITPYWAASMVKVAQIGSHIFYRP